MLIEYLLSKRMTGENQVAWIFTLPVIMVLVYPCPVAEFFGFCALLGAPLYAGFRIWSCSSVWSQLRDRRVIEELATVGVSRKQMLDEVMWFTCRAVWKATAATTAYLALCFTCGCGSDASWWPEIAATLLIVWLALPISLSYTIQAWSFWVRSGWWWAVLGVPIFYDFLLTIVMVPASLFSSLTLRMFITALGVCWLSRKLAQLGLDRKQSSSPSTRSWLKRRGPLLRWSNPVGARGLARFAGQPRLAVFILFLAAVWGGSVGAEIGPSPHQAMDALVGIFACLACAVAWLAYRTAQAERDAGTLELLKTTRLSGTNVVDGWVATAVAFPLLLVLVSVPFGISYSGVNEPAPLLLGTILGCVTMVFSAYLGVYATLYWRYFDSVGLLGAWIAFFCLLGTGPINWSLFLPLTILVTLALRGSINRRWNRL